MQQVLLNHLNLSSDSQCQFLQWQLTGKSHHRQDWFSPAERPPDPLQDVVFGTQLPETGCCSDMILISLPPCPKRSYVTSWLVQCPLPFCSIMHYVERVRWELTCGCFKGSFHSFSQWHPAWFKSKCCFKHVSHIFAGVQGMGRIDSSFKHGPTSRCLACEGLKNDSAAHVALRSVSALMSISSVGFRWLPVPMGKMTISAGFWVW